MLQRLKNALLGGIAVSFVVAVAFAADHISANSYLSRGLWRLALEALGDRLLLGLGLGLAGGLAYFLLSELISALPPIGRGASPEGRSAARLLLGLSVFAAGLVAFDDEFWKALFRPTRLGVGLRSMEGAQLVGSVALLGLAVAALLLVLYLVLRSRLVAGALGRIATLGARLVPPVAVMALATLAVALVSFALVQRLRAPTGPNVVLITVDTLRRDHLGVYGNRDVTPNLDRMAQSGIVFEHAMSQAPWTLPAMATIFTSLYPSQHGAIFHDRTLAPGITTFVEVLRNAGYQTVGATAHLFVGRKYGFDQGFERFDQSSLLWKAPVSSNLLSERASQLLDSVEGEPFFFWAHYFDPHHTYIGHPEFDLASQRGEFPERYELDDLESRRRQMKQREIRHVIDLYDEEVAFTDAAIGRLVEHIEAMPTERPTIFIFSADHGEHFMEHGRFGHGEDLHAQLLDVPLLVFGDVEEAYRGLVVKAPVETRQIGQTVLELARIEHDAIEGSSLLRVAAGRARGPAISFAESRYGGGQVAAMMNGWKLIRHLDDGTEELYRVDADPDEQRNLAGSERPAVVATLAQLRQAVEEFQQMDRAAAPPLELTSEELEHLKALGYVH